MLVLLMAVTGAWATITVTWNNDDITFTGDDTSFTKDGVTITAGAIDFDDKNFTGGGTFTTTLGNFTKIEVTTCDWKASGTGWSGSTWTGNASSVSFDGDIYGDGDGTTKFVFTIEPPTATVTQTIALAAGENWFSTNLDVTLADLQAALVTATGGTASITINSQGSGSSTYVPGKTAWRGKLTTLDVSQMYMITVEADCEITLEGTPADPAEHSVTIKPGYNWIGMTMSGSITVATAFAGFAVNGDKVSSSSGTATYSGSRWRGTLNRLEPGKGYIYYSAASEDKMLVFPTVE